MPIQRGSPEFRCTLTCGITMRPLMQPSVNPSILERQQPILVIGDVHGMTEPLVLALAEVEAAHTFPVLPRRQGAGQHRRAADGDATRRGLADGHFAREAR